MVFHGMLDEGRTTLSTRMLKRRASKTDEQVVEEAAQNDDEFVARIKRETGLDLTL